MERLASALSDRYKIERQLGVGGMATDYATVDFLKDLGAFPLGECLEQVHPDADLDAIDERTTATRDLVSGSIWTLLDSTF